MPLVHDLILFDLDGTLTDPLLGIGRCFNYTLAHFGYPERELANLASRREHVQNVTAGLPRPRVLVCIGRDMDSGTLSGMYMARPSPSCLQLAEQLACTALSLAFWRAGNSMAARIAIPTLATTPPP